MSGSHEFASKDMIYLQSLLCRLFLGIRQIVPSARCFENKLEVYKIIIHQKDKAMVSIIMGSDSDLPVMQQAAAVLEVLGVAHEVSVVSAHRTPERMFEFARTAHSRGIKVIIAGAGGAAHLPGMVASLSPLPVIGVPVKSSNSLDGWDSILSILQMPNGVPVATVALNAAKNAGILAAQILGCQDAELLERIIAYKKQLEAEVLEKSKKLEGRAG
jgi:5-(carboxyamino)imidazole ribonucleotide mutase